MRAHAAGFTPGELDWPATWTHRAGRDRTPSIPGHELSGTVVELGWGTTGLTAGGIVDRGWSGGLGLDGFTADRDGCCGGALIWDR